MLPHEAAPSARSLKTGAIFETRQFFWIMKKVISMIVKPNHRHFFVTMKEKICNYVRVKFWLHSLPIFPNADCI